MVNTNSPLTRNIAALTGGTFYSWAAYVTFFKALFARAFIAPYNLYDLTLAIAFICSALTVLLIIRDVFDGKKFDKYEKKRAGQAIGIIIGLFALGWLSATYLGEGTSLQALGTTTANQGEIQTTLGTHYGTIASPAQTLNVNNVLVDGTAYCTVAVANDTDYTTVMLKTNQSHLTWTEFKNYRGMNLTISQDGISRLQIFFWDTVDGYVVLLDSNVEATQFDITDMGSTTELNVTWTLADVLTWEAANIFNDPTESIRFKFFIGTDFVETTATTINWYWATVNTMTGYTITWAAWVASGVIPLLMMLEVIGKKKKSYRRKSRRRNYSRKRRSYRRRRRY